MNKIIGFILTVGGGILFVYFLIWCTGVLFWSFDIGLLFILCTGIIMLYIGIFKIKNKDPLFFIKYKMLKKIIARSLIMFFLIYIIIEGFILYNAFDDDKAIKADFVIIPGAQVLEDRPSLILKHRLQKAIPYILDNAGVSVIVSGSQGADEIYTEAEVMKRYLIENGVNKNQIIKEEKALNSYENVKYSKEIFDYISENNEPKVLIVTTDYHMFRMKMLFKNQGIEAYGISVPLYYTVVPITYAREVFSVVKAFVNNLF